MQTGIVCRVLTVDRISAKIKHVYNRVDNIYNDTVDCPTSDEELLYEIKTTIENTSIQVIVCSN